MPSVGSGTYAPGPNMVCSPQQEKVGTGSIEASTCPVYIGLRSPATVSVFSVISFPFFWFLMDDMYSRKSVIDFWSVGIETPLPPCLGLHACQDSAAVGGARLVLVPRVRRAGSEI